MPNDVIADFKVFTGGLILPSTKNLEIIKSYNSLFPNLPVETEDYPHVFMTGSSNVEDLQGDTVTDEGLASMAQVTPGEAYSNLYLNHNYTLPYSFFGKLLASPVIVKTGSIADLHLASDCTMKQDAAKGTYIEIQNGAHFGCSAGFIITKWHVEGEETDWWSPIFIDEVTILEFSVVGLPANPRAWVESGIKGLFERYIRTDDGDQALKLAPAYKGLFTNDYRDLVKSLRSDGLRKDLEARPIRSKSTNRLSWEPLTKSFVLTAKGGAKRALSTEEVEAILQESKALAAKALTETQESTDVPETPNTQEVSESVLETVEPATEQEETETPTTTEETPVEAPVAIESVPGVDHTVIDLDPVKQYQLQQFNALGTVLWGENWLPKGISGKFYDITGHSLKSFLATKEGRAISTENMKSLKVAHDALATVGGSEVCSNAPENDGNDNEDDGVDDGDGSTKGLDPALVTTLHETVEKQTLAVNALVDAIKSAQHIEKALEQVELVNKEVAVLAIKFKTAKTDINALADTVQALKDMPVGDPRSVKRSLNLEGEAVVDLKDLLPINQEHWTLESALQKTMTKTKTLHNGDTLTMLVWPAGVGKGLIGDVEGGVRPALSRKQISMTPPMMMIAYESGDSAEVVLTPGDYPEELLARQAALSR